MSSWRAGSRLRATTGGGSIAKLHIEHIPALLAGSLRNWLDRMIIGNAREAIPIDLPVAGGGAAACQELRLGFGCGMPVNGVALGVGQRRESVEGHGGGCQNQKLTHDPYSATVRMSGERQQGCPVAACVEDGVTGASRQGSRWDVTRTKR